MPKDDVEVEPIRGLPELPPEGEHILWQGAPDPWTLALQALNTGWVAGYFALLAAWRGLVVGLDQGWGLGAKATVPFLAMGLVACAILMVIAATLARTTVYTLTNRRVAMRIGAALTVTLNLPFTCILAADLALNRNGTGTIALGLTPGTKLSYLVCWPHVRPWRIVNTQPALRCIPDAARVAELLADAAQARMSVTADLDRRVRPAAVMAAE
jgi:hypothetical protein